MNEWDYKEQTHGKTWLISEPGQAVLELDSGPSETRRASNVIQHQNRHASVRFRFDSKTELPATRLNKIQIQNQIQTVNRSRLFKGSVSLSDTVLCTIFTPIFSHSKQTLATAILGLLHMIFSHYNGQSSEGSFGIMLTLSDDS